MNRGKSTPLITSPHGMQMQPGGNAPKAQYPKGNNSNHVAASSSNS